MNWIGAGRTSRERRSTSLARGAALFLGSYALIGVCLLAVSQRNDPNLWWVDLRMLPAPLAQAALALLSFCLLLFALHPAQSRMMRFASAGVLLSFAVATLCNALGYWQLVAHHAIQSPLWFPLSAVMCGVLMWIGWELFTHSTVRSRPGLVATAAIACAIIFPALQVFAFGKTDYQRNADVAVVFGARVYADGTLSDAVADRVHTAAGLYRRGLVRHLVMSGGPGDGAVHEADAMRAEAIREGVPANAILIDRAGLNTTATVQNTARLAATARWHRVIAVSEFYHLPRIKLAYAGQGMDVYTVPSKPRHWARAWAVANVAREVPAFWVYWMRAASGAFRTSHA